MQMRGGINTQKELTSTELFIALRRFQIAWDFNEEHQKARVGYNSSFFCQSTKRGFMKRLVESSWSGPRVISMERPIIRQMIGCNLFNQFIRFLSDLMVSD